jgi:hypothetical protein
MKILLLTIPVLLILSACTSKTSPLQESDLPTPFPGTTEPKDEIPCAPENWVIAITAVEQTDLGDSKKLVFTKIGIENNDSLWGSLNGPANETRKSVFLTTKDGSIYEAFERPHPIPSDQLSDQDQNTLVETVRIETPLMPPGFVALGKTIEGVPYDYNFAFLIPDSQEPDTITIGGIGVDCIQSHVVGGNGKPVFRHKNIQLPVRTYDLETDVADVREAPSARRYPNLVGAELVTPDWKETLFITDVTRNGNTIDVTFDYTNFSSHPMSPSFNGYIMGSSRHFICQKDCESQPTHEPVEPGQTAQDLTWTFTLPEDENNLTFVYAYGSKIDLNEVYRVNLE